MEKSNATTVAQAVIASLMQNGVDLNNVMAICTDNAAFCKVAFNIMKPVMPNSTHVLCLVYIVNLVGDCFAYWHGFANVNSFVWLMKSTFNKKLQRKQR